jgi:ribosomal protein S18 acetylase RimI-like enzyme
MIEVSSLPANRWKDYRRLRLEALRTDGAAFGSSYGEEVKLSARAWRQRMKNCLFALSENRPVGEISVVFSDRVKTRHIAFIYGFYVTPMARGKGVGTMLMESALAKVRANKGIVKVALSVNPAYKAALSVYEKAGFRVCGTATKELKVGRRFYDMLNMELFVNQ